MEVSPGTIEGTIVADAPKSNDSPVSRYCLCLEAGAKISIETAARGAAAVSDTIAFLVDGEGKVVAYNDDDIAGGTSYSKIVPYTVETSGPHMVVVQPFSPADDVGDFSVDIKVE